jgi:hypothetical protein
MAIVSSGQVALTDLQTEFGGSAPTALSEYYRGGSVGVPSSVSAVPTSGEIRLSNFYGTQSALIAATNVTVSTQDLFLGPTTTAAVIFTDSNGEHRIAISTLASQNSSSATTDFRVKRISIGITGVDSNGNPDGVAYTFNTWSTMCWSNNSNDTFTRNLFPDPAGPFYLNDTDGDPEIISATKTPFGSAQGPGVNKATYISNLPATTNLTVI